MWKTAWSSLNHTDSSEWRSSLARKFSRRKIFLFYSNSLLVTLMLTNLLANPIFRQRVFRRRASWGPNYMRHVLQNPRVTKSHSAMSWILPLTTWCDPTVSRTARKLRSRGRSPARVTFCCRSWRLILHRVNLCSDSSANKLSLYFRYLFRCKPRHVFCPTLCFTSYSPTI